MAARGSERTQVLRVRRWTLFQFKTSTKKSAIPLLEINHIENVLYDIYLPAPVNPALFLLPVGFLFILKVSDSIWDQLTSEDLSELGRKSKFE